MSENHILEARNLSLSFGGNMVLADVGFNLNQAEILGLIGPNGAGKTSATISTRYGWTRR